MEYSREAVLRTLLYADIFDCPLTKQELWRFLLTDITKATKNAGALSYKNFAALLPRSVVHRDGWYFLSGQELSIKRRKKRIKISKNKIEIAKRVTRYLSVIPGLLFIGVSGACAVYNAKEDDDIDMFLIVKRQSLWTSRLLALFILECMGIRRQKAAKSAKNKICLNMLIDETRLAFGEKIQDVYTAHEIAQVIPIFDRNNTYKKFLLANKWVRDFLPNSVDLGRVEYRGNTISTVNIFTILFARFELIARRVQLWYMRKHITKEIVSDSFLAFHPIDYRAKVIKEYGKRVRQYAL